MAEGIIPADDAYHRSDDFIAPRPLMPLSSMETRDDFRLEDNDKIHSCRILEGLNSFRLKKEFCDVILCCGALEFHCHRNVLASFSPYFEAMFASEWKESQQPRVVINGVDPESVGLLVDYAYTAELTITMENVQFLLGAADLLNVENVKGYCCNYMERHINDKNCIGLHCFAEAHGCKRLAKLSFHGILDHFRDVCQQEEFLSLSVDKLIEILSHDDINVPKEEMVFEAAMSWLNGDPTTRRQSFRKVLEHIRLPVISPSYLQDSIETLDVVKESQGCQRLLSEAKQSRDLLIPYGHRAEPRTPTVIVNVRGISGESIQCFDPLNNQWKELACLPFDVGGHSLVVLDNVLYLVGGISGGTASKETWRYDPSLDSWVLMASMNHARHNFGLVEVGGFLFAMGGLHSDNLYDIVTVEDYDPACKMWSFFELQVEAMDTEFFELQVEAMDTDTPYYFYTVALDERIYVIGGYIDEEGQQRKTTNEVRYYDPKTSQWTDVAPMNEPHGKAGVAVVDGKIYVLGGLGSDFSSIPAQTIERYCDDTNTWEMVGEMPNSHSWSGCVSLRLKKDAYAVKRIFYAPALQGRT